MAMPRRLIPLSTIFLAGLALLAAFMIKDGPSPQPIQAGERPSVVFIVIETLRADHIRAWGHGRNTMPIVEDIAREGIRFEHAIAAAPWTLPSVTSILTGLAPAVHGVRTYEDVVPDDAVTLAERFSEAGYETAFFGVNSLFEADRNVEQGFETYYGIDEIPGTQLNERLSGFLNHRSKERPLFLYVHYFEPHCRYAPPEDMREMYLPAPPELATDKRITHEQFKSMHECFHLNRRSGEPILDIDHYLAEYDAELRYVDHLMGLFIERLKTAGVYEQSLVAIMGDHGEEFWEHGTFGHGRSLNEEAIHVPLVIKPPGGVKGGTYTPPVSALDLAPTALDVAGLPGAEEAQGQSLAPIWQGGDTAALARRGVFSETDYETFHFRSVHLGSSKLIFNTETGESQLFDLKLDPLQLTDIATAQPKEVATLGALLEAHVNQSRERARDIGTHDLPIDKDVIERLRALGYTL